MDVTLSPTQSEVFADTARFKVLVTGRRFGKTFLALIWLYTQSLRNPEGSLHYYVCPTQKQAKKVAWRDLKALTAERAVKINESELYVEVVNNFGTTSIIQLAGADNQDALRGISLSSLVLDESAYINKDVWSLVLRPACSDKKAPVLFISSPAGYNWLYDLYQYGLKNDVTSWNSWMFTTADGGNVDEEEIEAAKRELSAKQFAQEYLASFEILANRVYDEFDRHVHVQDFDLPDEDEHLYIGIDFNIDPMTASVAVKVGDELHIVDEFNQENSRTELLCEAIRYRYPNNPITVFPDPACKARGTNSTDTNLSILRESRWNFDVDVKSKHDKVVDRVNTVQRLLKSAKGVTRLYISRRCVNVIKCMEGQVYKNGVPDKSGGLDHMCFHGNELVNVNGKEMEFKNIPEKGEVLCTDGNYRVYSNGGLIKSSTDMIQLTLSNNKTIKCTPDHKFLTTEGWVEAKDLIGKELCDQKYFQTSNNYITEKFTTYVGNTFKEMALDSIAKFMKINMAPSQKDVMSIIKTMTGAITIPKIWNCYQHHNISAIITRIVQKNHSTVMLTSKPQSGIKAMKAGNGTKRTTTMSRRRCIGKDTRINVPTVEMSTNRTRKVQCFVQETARQTTEEYQALMTRHDAANTAKKISQQINTQEKNTATRDVQLTVEAISTIGKHDAYCLTVDGYGMFDVKGVCVSNCDNVGYLCCGVFPIQKQFAPLDFSESLFA